MTEVSVVGLGHANVEVSRCSAVDKGTSAEDFTTITVGAICIACTQIRTSVEHWIAIAGAALGIATTAASDRTVSMRSTDAGLD